MEISIGGIYRDFVAFFAARAWERVPSSHWLLGG
jgi:hypothetical protein